MPAQFLFIPSWQKSCDRRRSASTSARSGVPSSSAWSARSDNSWALLQLRRTQQPPRRPMPRGAGRVRRRHRASRLRRASARAARDSAGISAAGRSNSPSTGAAASRSAAARFTADRTAAMSGRRSRIPSQGHERGQGDLTGFASARAWPRGASNSLSAARPAASAASAVSGLRSSFRMPAIADGRPHRSRSPPVRSAAAACQRRSGRAARIAGEILCCAPRSSTAARTRCGLGRMLDIGQVFGGQPCIAVGQSVPR